MPRGFRQAEILSLKNAVKTCLTGTPHEVAEKLGHQEQKWGDFMKGEAEGEAPHARKSTASKAPARSVISKRGRRRQRPGVFGARVGHRSIRSSLVGSANGNEISREGKREKGGGDVKLISFRFDFPFIVVQDIQEKI